MNKLLTQAEQHLRQAVKRYAVDDARGAMHETKTTLRLLAWANDRCEVTDACRMILEADRRIAILQECMGRSDRYRIIQAAIKADFYIRHAASKAGLTIDPSFQAAVKEIYGQFAG